MKESDYEFVSYGGDRPDSHFGFEIRRGLPMDLLPALRDSEGDLANWRRSPLRPLLDGVAGRIDGNRTRGACCRHHCGNGYGRRQRGSQGTRWRNQRSRADHGGPDPRGRDNPRLSPTDPERLLRALRLFIDAASVKSAPQASAPRTFSILTLKALELEQLVAEGQRHHTFLAIEEPEAHSDPHLQRLCLS